MTTPTALDSFLDKWRSRWPEWAVAEVFIAEDRRAATLAWFALLQEFDDILNIAGDPLPALRLAWSLLGQDPAPLRGIAGRDALLRCALVHFDRARLPARLHFHRATTTTGADHPECASGGTTS